MWHPSPPRLTPAALCPQRPHLSSCPGKPPLPHPNIPAGYLCQRPNTKLLPFCALAGLSSHLLQGSSCYRGLPHKQGASLGKAGLPPLLPAAAEPQSGTCLELNKCLTHYLNLMTTERAIFLQRQMHIPLQRYWRGDNNFLRTSRK